MTGGRAHGNQGADRDEANGVRGAVGVQGPSPRRGQQARARASQEPGKSQTSWTGQVPRQELVPLANDRVARKAAGEEEAQGCEGGPGRVACQRVQSRGQHTGFRRISWVHSNSNCPLQVPRGEQVGWLTARCASCSER